MFEPVDLRVSKMAMEVICMLTIDATAAKWSTKTDTIKEGGQGNYVILQKIQSYVEYSQNSNIKEVATTMKWSGLLGCCSAQGSTSSKEIVLCSRKMTRS